MSRPLSQDGLGLMYIEPNCNGTCWIEFWYDGGFEMSIAHWLALTSWLFAGGLVVSHFRKKNRREFRKAASDAGKLYAEQS